MQPNSKANNYRIQVLKFYGSLLKDKLSEIASLIMLYTLKIFSLMLSEVACAYFAVIT